MEEGQAAGAKQAQTWTRQPPQKHLQACLPSMTCRNPDPFGYETMRGSKEWTITIPASGLVMLAVSFGTWFVLVAVSLVV